jgi:hypothetical protein
MQETFEFRVVEDFANRLFSDDEGRMLASGQIRVIRMASSDARIPLVGKLQAEIRRDYDRSFFHGWNIDRQYSETELASAKAFRLWPTRSFEPSGESCGTIYDEVTACPNCGAGATQVSGLRLDLRKVPKGSDIARTIAGEIIVSQHLAEFLTDGEFKGIELRPVRHKARYEDDSLDLEALPSGRKVLDKAEAAGAPHPTGRFWVWLNRSKNLELYERVREEWVARKQKKRRSKSRAAPVWHQLIATATVDIVAPTRVGIDPFDDDTRGECRCPLGDTIGLNVLSEVWLSRRQFLNCDIARTTQFVGIRRGVLRPEPLLIISPRLQRALEENKVKGVHIDVAHLK